MDLFYDFNSLISGAGRGRGWGCGMWDVSIIRHRQPRWREYRICKIPTYLHTHTHTDPTDIVYQFSLTASADGLAMWFDGICDPSS